METNPDNLDERRRSLQIKLALQIEDAQRYREWAGLILGKTEVTDDELLLWYITEGYARMFGLAWETSRTELNRYYSGLDVEHDPTPVECYWHYTRWQDGITVRAEASA